MTDNQLLSTASDPLDDSGGLVTGAQPVAGGNFQQNQSASSPLVGQGVSTQTSTPQASTATTSAGTTVGTQDDTVISGTLNIPPEIIEKFADLIELIKGSKSMDDEERQYWVDVLPIMSADQIGNLRGILENEKKQLAAAANAYSEGVNEAAKKAAKAFDEAAYLEKKRVREDAEKKHEAEEASAEASVLAELQAL